jgi:hypothetical protein
MQGSVRSLGFLMAGTDECLEDKRRGLYSYEALRSRLVENRFATDGVVDFSGTVVRLQNLSPEDLVVLLRNIRNVQANGDPAKYIVPDDALIAVLKKASETLGADYYKTPRDVVRSFVGLLSVLEQNPERNWQDFLAQGLVKSADKPISIEEEISKGSPPTPDNDDQMASFKL